MKRLLGLVLAWAISTGGPSRAEDVQAEAAGTRLTVTTNPSPIVLMSARRRHGARRQRSVVARITLAGLPGHGPVEVATNVGRVVRVDLLEDRVQLHYRGPTARFPQELCVLVWRTRGGPVSAVHVPLLGRAYLKIRTRRRSRVVITAGTLHFGPYKSGRRGRVRARVLVPPGIERAQVQATDRYGLITVKQIAIHRRPYNRLVLAIQRLPDASGKTSRFRATVVLAESGDAVPQFQIERLTPAPAPAAAPRQLQARDEGRGRWSALWSSPRDADPQRWLLRVGLPGSRISSRESQLDVAALAHEAPVAKQPPMPQPASRPFLQRAERPSAPQVARRRLRWTVGAAVGLMHNLGELFSPRFGIEVGVRYPLPVGQIGAHVLAGFAWSSQQIEGSPTVGTANSDVMLLPIGVGLTYRLPLGLVSPYAQASFITQLIRTRNTGDQLAELVRHDVALGGLFLGGAELSLGPGAAFLQGGYQWTNLDSPDIDILAGGLVVEGGYRFIL